MFEIWRHRASGERFLVVVRDGRVTVAAGPLPPGDDPRRVLETHGCQAHQPAGAAGHAAHARGLRARLHDRPARAGGAGRAGGLTRCCCVAGAARTDRPGVGAVAVAPARAGVRGRHAGCRLLGEESRGSLPTVETIYWASLLYVGVIWLWLAYRWRRRRKQRQARGQVRAVGAAAPAAAAQAGPGR
jgi:hypothetical protein